ncbi:MAG: hypothetical protein WCP72_12055 [Desulfomonile sp.]
MTDTEILSCVTVLDSRKVAERPRVRVCQKELAVGGARYHVGLLEAEILLPLYARDEVNWQALFDEELQGSHGKAQNCAARCEALRVSSALVLCLVVLCPQN